MLPGEILNQAESFLQRGKDLEAQDFYENLIQFPDFAPLAFFRIGEILNRRGLIEDSAAIHQKAFDQCPTLLSKISPPNFKHHGYTYSKSEQIFSSICPICEKEGRSHSCYNTATYLDFAPGFDPIRIWLICDECNHIFASSRPKNLENILQATSMGTLDEPDIGACPILGRILKQLMSLTDGQSFFEVGVGMGEMIGVAMELGLKTSGIEIRPEYASKIQELFSVTIHSDDFLNFEPNNRYDIIAMGDVLEHFVDPLLALRKAANLLKDGGVLWISTPNFESAFCRLLADKDPMWKVCEHLQFFSFKSLKAALDRCELVAFHYELSTKYRGSMEVMIRKK